MRIFRSIMVALTVLTVCTGMAWAQTPTVRVYFDSQLTAESKDCPGGGGVDSMFVVAQDFGNFIAGVELAIMFPPSMTWIADTNKPPASIGNSVTGISIGFPLPQNAFGKLEVYTVIFNWNCSGCVVTDGAVVVSPHPITGFVRATQWPTLQFINATGMTGLVCPTVPVEDTTWGRVKALYSDAR